MGDYSATYDMDRYHHRSTYSRYQYLTPTARPLLGDNAPSRAMDYDRQRREYLRHKTLKGYRNYGAGVACNVDVSNVNDGTGWDECYPAKSFHSHIDRMPGHDYGGRWAADYPRRRHDHLDYCDDLWAPRFSGAGGGGAWDAQRPQRDSWGGAGGRRRYAMDY